MSVKTFRKRHIRNHSLRAFFISTRKGLCMKKYIEYDKFQLQNCEFTACISQWRRQLELEWLCSERLKV